MHVHQAVTSYNNKMISYQVQRLLLIFMAYEEIDKIIFLCTCQ